MPNINEFIEDNNKKPYALEEINGTRPCSKCDENVVGALWDAVEYIMTWTCSKGHKTEYKVN